MLKNVLNIFNKRKVNSKNFYEVLGQETGLYELVKNFYTKMENDPKAKECLISHELTADKKIPDEVKKKLFMFLCGWLGGPNLFQEAYGHPRMRARHMHIEIGPKEKSQWLYCMQDALKKQRPPLSKSQRKQLLNSFTALAMRIQNKN